MSIEEQSKREKVVLLFHKDLSNIDGQVNYVKSIISALQSEYEIVIPSENFFARYPINDRKWTFRVLLLNILLSKYLINNRSELKQRLKFIIVEDRYLPFPAFFSHLFLQKPVIYRVSDWGIAYAKSLHFTLPFVKALYVVLAYLYQICVKRFGKAIILPSEHLKNEIPMHIMPKVLTFPYVFTSHSSDLENGPIGSNEKCFTRSIVCVFIGNFNYSPNIESAKFIIERVAPEVFAIDKDVLFLVVGTKGDEIFTKKPFPNVFCTGFVEDTDSLLKKCNIGINPSVAHGGTSIKNIDYMVNGLFFVSTPAAAEGVIHSDMLKIADREHFSEKIISIINHIKEGSSVDRKEVDRVRSYYSFETNKKKILDFLKSISTKK